jgi:hypothetical protein
MQGTKQNILLVLSLCLVCCVEHIKGEEHIIDGILSTLDNDAERNEFTMIDSIRILSKLSEPDWEPVFLNNSDS